jgi:hypothetical protein
MIAKRSPSMKPDDVFLSALEVYNSHLGHDPVLQHMIRKGLQPTAETYRELAWFDELDEIDPEDQELLDALKILEARNYGA